jgi:hypothetical protein
MYKILHYKNLYILYIYLWCLHRSLVRGKTDMAAFKGSDSEGEGDRPGGHE